MHFDNHVIAARWARTGAVAKNWGDLLNPDLMYRLSATPVVHSADILGWGDRPVHRVIGSGLGHCSANDVVWGMGFIDRDSTPSTLPAKICAVRGPLSRRRLLDLGVDCPEVYGDPAVLFPMFYLPRAEKKYEVGVIQHCREFNVLPPPKLNGTQNVTYIDICSGINEVIKQIVACERIVSSSLHGLICAHAYGVPAVWFKASDLPLGDDFKFHDYYASIGYDDIAPINLTERHLFEAGNQPDRPGDSRIDHRKLIESCPFISSERKKDLVKRVAQQNSYGLRGTIYSRQSAG